MIKPTPVRNPRSAGSSKQIGGRFVLIWWLLSLSVLLWFPIIQRVLVQDRAIAYLVLWFLIVTGFFVFVRHWSFSAILGRPFDVLEIPVYLGLTSLFLIQAFGLAPYFDEKYLRLLPSTSYLPSGLLLTGTGLFSLLLGYALVSRSCKPYSPKAQHTSYDTPSLSLSFFVYIGILFLRLALIANGSGEMIVTTEVIRMGGNWHQWLGYLAELRWFFIALVTLQVFGGRWPLLFFVLVLMIESAMAIISGWASLLPKIILLVIGCLIYTRPKLPWRTLIPVGIAVTAIVIFSIPVTRNMRFVGQVTLSNIANSIEVAWGEGFDHGWRLFSDLVIGRQTTIAQTPSILLSLVPSAVPYLPLQELAVAPITFIPRVLWPSKPAYSSIGSWVTVHVFGGQEGGASSAVTMAGNAYMYGGWGVVIIGMLMVGVLAALMYRAFAIPGLLHNQVGLLAVYAAVVIANFHLGESDFVSIWQGLIQRTLVFLVVARLLCEKNTHGTLSKP
jgi:hypothetical protein